MEYTLQNARVRHMKGVHALLRGGAGEGLLLPRSLSDLYSHTRDFVVLLDADACVVGCCALSIVWEDLAEIRSLFVRDDLRIQGQGRALVEACLDSARDLRIRKVFTLTYQTAFFAKLGFSEVGKDLLPQKIWADCIHCPKFPDCDETAMHRDIEAEER
jgi:amino-acid N-acetyltransferase